MKNIIKTFAACCVFVLGEVRLDAATATGQSGNCTVNTCDLTVTASSEPNGVHLEWRPLLPSTTYVVYRDGTRIYTYTAPNDSMYVGYGLIDPGAVYGKTHAYKVEAKLNPPVSATVPGIRGGTGKAPSIISVIPAKLWLEHGIVNNVQLEVSDYDENRYAVERLIFSVKLKDGAKKTTAEFKTVDKVFGKQNLVGKHVFNLSTYDMSGHPLGFVCSEKIFLSGHGEFDITVECEIREMQTGKREKVSGSGKGVAYFQKYDNVGGEPAWFHYWKSGNDGAVPALGDEVEYGDSGGNKLGECKSTLNDVYNAGFNNVNGFNYPVVIKYGSTGFALKIYENGAAQHSKIVVKGGRVVGGSGMGIECAAIVCAHELEHRKTDRDLYDGRYKPFIKPSDTALNSLAEYVRTPTCSEQVKAYYAQLVAALNVQNEWAIDEDHDSVRDTYERDKNLGLKYGKDGEKDTFEVGSAKSIDGKTLPFDEYKKYGDNEYISRYYEDANKKFYPNKDFAFPGSKIGQDYQGLRPFVLFPYSSVENSLQNTFTGNRGVSKALMASSVVRAANSFEDENYRHGRLYDWPDVQPQPSSTNVSVISVEHGYGDNLNEGRYGSLTFPVHVNINGGNASDVIVSGWLVDSVDNPVAWARCKLGNVIGENVANLQFAGGDIFASAANGFKLKYLAISFDEIDDPSYIEIKEDAAVADRTYSYSEFVPYAGYIRECSDVLNNSGGDLEATAAIEICSNGVYSLSARLIATNGGFVASTLVTNLNTIGVSSVTFNFDRRDIFLSRQNGPYKLEVLDLRDGRGVQIDSKADVFTTAAYSYRDFADGSETIFADAGSFRREADLVGADGLCDALNFSFVVTNLAPSEVEYVARIYLCGTNDELVCSSTRNVVLSNEVNHVTIAFRGLEIKKRDVEGPYYVSEVAIEDAECGELVERFKPEQILIDRCLDEFGSSPVAINGEVTLSEATEGSPFVVEVPVQAIRPGTVTVSAVLVATNGTPVAYVEASRDFAANETGSLSLRFSDDEIVRSGVRGPYYVKYVAIRSGYEGLDEVQVDDPGLGVLNRQFTLYVDCAKEDDSGDGLTPATAKATIRGALAIAQPGDLILVADGVYEPFECYVSDVTIRSKNGPEKTIIDGEGQLRCAYFARYQWNQYQDEHGEWHYEEHKLTGGVIEGFTLRNGWTMDYGGGIYGGTARHCIIGNNTAGNGGGMSHSILENCIVYGNTADTAGGGAYFGELYNCTVAENTANVACGGVCASAVYNSIVWGNGDVSGIDPNYGTETITDYDDYNEETGLYPTRRTEFYSSCTFPMPEGGEGNICDNPLLADAAHGDMRLRSISPCIDAGSEDWVCSDVDLCGVNRIQGSAPEMGAIENNFEDRICVSAKVRGNGTISPTSAFVGNDGSVTFTALETGARPFLRFETNGVYASSERTLVLANVHEEMSVVAVFAPGELYVSVNGSNDNDGSRWAMAKATIQGAIDSAVDGDVIYVGEGIYSPFDSNNRRLTIQSVTGAEKTIIDANGAGSCASMGGYYSVETNTVLSGFTLRNGNVLNGGGGAYGGTLIECRIENNRSGASGGGLYRAAAVRCIISGNIVEYDSAGGTEGWVSISGGGAYDCKLENCLIVSNFVHCTQGVNGGYGGGAYACLLLNCTVIGNAIESEDGFYGYPYGGGIYNGSAYNTICWGNTVNGTMSNVEWVNESDGLWVDEDPVFADLIRYTLAENSPCVDAGSDTYVSGSNDLYGNYRINGLHVDIGACEYSNEPQKTVYNVRFDANGGEGEMYPIEVVYSVATNLPANAYWRSGYSFIGWAKSPDGEVVYKNGDTVVNLAEEGEVTIYARWMSSAIAFIDETIQSKEGSAVGVSVFGGYADSDASVQLYLTCNTATAADLDLAKGAIDGVTPKGGLKFPLALSWETGELGEKVISIPVKADKAVEGDEFFTLQLAAPVGMELGDARVCTVTIRDPGYYDLEAKIASGTATKAEQTAWDKLLKAKAPYVLGLADPAEAGKVAGSGLCANGKKVTLKATANKGFVFRGWYDGDTLLSQAASYTPDMPETDKTLYAKFITAEEDRASITLSLSGMDLDSPSVAPVALATNITCGVALEWQLAAGALSATTIKVAGLPAGLKFAAKDVVDPKTKQETVKANTIYGAPTAASKVGKDGKPTPSEVKITVTTAGKSSATYLVRLMVDPLPEWAVGTFDGDVESGGIVQAFTVATSGKIGGKVLEGGRTWALSASSFDMVEDSAFFATVIGKAGKEVVTNEVAVAAENGVGVASGIMATETPRVWSAWQNLWCRPDTKAEMPVFKKSFDVTLESGLKLTFKKNGAVSFAGKVEGVGVSGSSQLVCGDNGWHVTLYAPPKGSFPGWCATISVALVVDVQNVVIDVVAVDLDL